MSLLSDALRIATRTNPQRPRIYHIFLADCPSILRWCRALQPSRGGPALPPATSHALTRFSIYLIVSHFYLPLLVCYVYYWRHEVLLAPPRPAASATQVTLINTDNTCVSPGRYAEAQVGGAVPRHCRCSSDSFRDREHAREP